MYDHITPTRTASSEAPLEVKKRKSGYEFSEAAQALLSMDVKRLAESKRIRPSQFSYDARDLSPERNTSNLEDRDRKDDEMDSEFSCSDSSPILNRRLVGQDELASALALASLAYSPPKRIEPPRAKVRIVEDTRSYSRAKPLVSPETHYPRYNPGRNNSVVHKYCQYPFDQMPYMPLDRMIHTNRHSTFTRNDALYHKKWKCDFCHVHAFASYEDAVNHEKVCSLNPARSKMDHKRPFQAQSAEYFTCLAEEDESKYFCGIIPLGIPEADPQWLSEMNCFIRNNCIEAFSANDDDVRKSSKRGRINPKQVGLRCKFCAHVNDESQGMSGVSYPVSSSGIHESVKRWFKIHLRICNYIPEDVKDKIYHLEKTYSISTRRRYWIDSAKALGIDDTVGGLRFIRDIQDPNNTKIAAKMLEVQHKPAKPAKREEEGISPTEEKSYGGYIVSPEDADIITPYLYLLLRQVEHCQFTEIDMYLARSNCDIGFNGFQCRHCHGHTGLGKYFPLTPKALCTNSTSQNIFSHLQKCSECPDEIKEELKKKRIENQQSKRSGGWRQAFFDRLWRRLHGGETQSYDK